MIIRKRVFFILSAIMLITGCGSTDISSYQSQIEPKVEAEREDNLVNEENKKGERSLETNPADEKVEETIQEQIEIPNAYKDIINDVYEFITADSDERAEDSIIGWGLVEAYRDGGTTEGRLSSIGYLLYDIDHNGIQELIIVEKELDDNRILCMYTLDGVVPILLIEGWARRNIFLLEDDVIYRKGYNGAAYTSFSTWHIAEDGISLTADEYYFSDYINGPEDPDSWSWFYNTTGEYDIEVSEVVEFENVEDGFELMEEYEARKKHLDVVYFCDYLGRK